MKFQDEYGVTPIDSENMSAVAWGKWLCSSMAAVVTSANGDDCEIEILHSALGPGGPRLGVSYTDPTTHCIQVSPLHDLMRKYPFHADRARDGHIVVIERIDIFHPCCAAWLTQRRRSCSAVLSDML
jgi:hypothetical protein